MRPTDEDPTDERPRRGAAPSRGTVPLRPHRRRAPPAPGQRSHPPHPQREGPTQLRHPRHPAHPRRRRDPARLAEPVSAPAGSRRCTRRPAQTAASPAECPPRSPKGSSPSSASTPHCRSKPSSKPPASAASTTHWPPPPCTGCLRAKGCSTLAPASPSPPTGDASPCARFPPGVLATARRGSPVAEPYFSLSSG